MSEYKKLEELIVYQKLCKLHIEVCEMTRKWPADEKFELGSQVRRSSNSSPAQLAEKYDDRHLRNKIEGVNRSRGEAGETVHHLFVAKLKGYESEAVYQSFRERYKECIRILNGIERKLELYLPERERRWPDKSDQGSGFGSQHSTQATALREEPAEYKACPPGYPEPDLDPAAPDIS
ncbi:MAG: hypothetical protein C5B50_27435 [Verrucomicrobia bacterium]|nr:MAG: hypothetical protein C5B50_27435 [Verrucomicrobiota bacterium]